MNNAVTAILVALFLIQILIPKARLNKSGLFGILSLALSAAVIFGLAFYNSWQQYLTWSGNDLSKLFLPPYQSWDYFVFYARTRFFNSYFLSLAIGLVFLAAAKYFNKKYQERFFEPIEPYLLAVSIFLIGHPGWLIYLIILLATNLLISYFLFLISKKKERRLSFYYFWLPAAISTILISRWLSALSWWQTLKF